MGFTPIQVRGTTITLLDHVVQWCKLVVTPGMIIAWIKNESPWQTNNGTDLSTCDLNVTINI